MAVILPADDEHPPRLNVPIWRHLTYVEAHAMELAVYVAPLILGAVFLGLWELALAMGVWTYRWLTGKNRSCDHSIGFHDAKEEPQYFVIPLLALVAGGMLANYYWGFQGVFHTACLG